MYSKKITALMIASMLIGVFGIAPAIAVEETQTVTASTIAIVSVSSVDFGGLVAGSTGNYNSSTVVTIPANTSINVTTDAGTTSAISNLVYDTDTDAGEAGDKDKILSSTNSTTEFFVVDTGNKIGTTPKSIADGTKTTATDLYLYADMKDTPGAGPDTVTVTFTY